MLTPVYAGIAAKYDDSYTELHELTNNGNKLDLGYPLFSITLGDGQKIDSTGFKLLTSKNNTHVLKHEPTGLACQWHPVVKPGTDYLRHEFTVKATKPVVVASFSPLLVSSQGFKPTGNVLGSPLATDDWYAAMEYPMAFTEVDTTSIGAWSPSQLRENQYATVKMPAQELSGKSQIEFKYTRGTQKILIRRVALIADGKVISEDVHNGEAGDKHINHIYTVDATDAPAGAMLVAEIRAAEQRIDSYGVISVVGQKSSSRYVQGVRLDREMKPGDSFTYSSVYGQRGKKSLRRAFMAYLENERARPYSMFLHYNSWYDICHSEPRYNLTSENCSRVMREWHEKLTKKHGVQLDSYVFDDGWDDYENLWEFRKESFPKGFTPQAELAKKFNTHVGVWFSPFGGYGGAQATRIRHAKPKGYEVNGAGLSLAGKNYYALFLKQCRMMMQQYEVNYFKFDGLGGANPEFLPDVEAAYRLMQTLRKDDPSLYINLTTGTWASPFFLLHGDSTWRGGADVHHRGSGPPTQKWLNYRDGETYVHTVSRGSIFPLNSLMIIGIAYANRGEGKRLIDDSDEEFAMQAWSSFATGTQLQEFYISADRMNDAKWKSLADAAKWGRGNQHILIDSHWIGGNPYKEELYGWASLSPDGKKAILCVRNPAGKEQSGAFTLTKILETVPGDWKVSSTLFKSPTAGTKVQIDGDQMKVALPPYKLTVFELER